MSENDLHKLFDKYLSKEPFVKLTEAGTTPELKDVLHTNDCRIGLALRESTGMAVIVSAIDNLMKGAAGQAVQAANIMLGLPEETGLPLHGWMP